LCALASGARADVDRARLAAGKRATALVEIRNEKGTVHGSAFCIDATGLFVTNDHVASAALKGDRIELILPPAIVSVAPPDQDPSGAAADPEPAAPVVDLLKLVGGRGKVISGAWAAGPDGLRSTRVGGGNRILLPYAPPIEYDLRFVYARLDGHEAVCAICPMPRGTLLWIGGGWNDVVFGFGHTDDGAWHTLVKRDLPADTIRRGVRYTCVVSVRKDSITASLDGKVVCTMATDGDGHRVPLSAIDGTPVLGFDVNDSALISEIDLTEVTGKGRVLGARK
jgi:hypothetical protein